MFIVLNVHILVLKWVVYERVRSSLDLLLILSCTVKARATETFAKAKQG